MPGLSCGTGLPHVTTPHSCPPHPCCAVRCCSACHVAVGTPGRLATLMQRGALPGSRIRLLVLDEADKLLGSESFVDDMETILGALPEKKQVGGRFMGWGKAFLYPYSLLQLSDQRGRLRRCKYWLRSTWLWLPCPAARHLLPDSTPCTALHRRAN